MEKLLVSLSIIISGFVIAFSILLASGNLVIKNNQFPFLKFVQVERESAPVLKASQPEVSSEALGVKVQKIELGTNPVLGEEGASVEVVEFGDFQCPYCGRFFREIESRLRKDFVETGKVKFAYRDFAFLGPESKDAALAARCASDQGKFWAYHDKLFGSQNGENQGAFGGENLKAFAKTIGLNPTQFGQCFNQRKYDTDVQKEFDETLKLKINSTPTLFVNGRPVLDLYNYEGLSSLIKGLLAE